MLIDYLFFLFIVSNTVLVTSCSLPEFINDAWNDANQLGLHVVIHIQNQIDVVASVATFDGYA